MRVIAFVCCVTLLTGCDIGGKLSGRRISMSGAGVVLGTPLTPYGSDQLARLIETSIPIAESPPAPTSDPSERKTEAKSELDEEQADRHLDTAIGNFSRALYQGGSANVERQNDFRYARNHIQGMLMARSANLCTAYKLALRERATTVSFLLGTTSTLLGTAGAVVTGTAAQALSAAAGAASGTKAEYERDILSSVTTSVIIPGIDKQRTSLQQEIADRRCLGVESYTLSQAILDALRYHSACSTDTGIAVAGSAISQSRVTTLADAKQAVDAVNALGASLAGHGTEAKPSPPEQQTRTPLLGDPVALDQCRPLESNGILPDYKDVVRQQTATRQPVTVSKAVQAIQRQLTPARPGRNSALGGQMLY